MSEGSGSHTPARPSLADLHQRAARKKTLKGGRARRQRVKKPRRAELASLVAQWLAPAVVVDTEGFVVFANEVALEELQLSLKKLVGYPFETPEGWSQHPLEWRDEAAILWLKQTRARDTSELEARCAQLEQQAERASRASDRLLDKMEKMVDRSKAEVRAVKKQLTLVEEQAACAKDRFLQAEREVGAATRELDEIKRQLSAERSLRTRSQDELNKLKASTSHSRNRLDEADDRVASARRSADQAKARAQASDTKLRLANERIAELEALVQKHIPDQEDALLSMLNAKRRNRGY